MIRVVMTKTAILSADDTGLAHAAELLRRGETVAFPTETVYGLGADATDGEAVARIYEAKGRPRFNPLIVHVPDLEAAHALIDLTEEGVDLATRFWPGPLTLVAPMRTGSGVAELVTAGLPTLAVRVPAHPLAQKMLVKVGRPVAAPSANPSGSVSPTTAQHVLDGLSGRIAAVMDGGACPVGLESTIVGFDDKTPVLLRSGGVPRETIETVAGAFSAPVDGGITAPGQLASHYAPGASLRLNAEAPGPGEAWLAFGPGSDAGAHGLNLSPCGDLIEAAANLFAYLRRLDATAERIAVAKIPATGLGEAINDRLNRAAAPRP